MAEVFWVSLDPVRRRIDFYPSAMSLRLEASLAGGSPECVLGADFFNATVHFQQGGAYYQTTPGQQMGRGGFKQPGYRSVRRVVKSGPSVTIHGKRVHGEWRIVEAEGEAEYTFVEQVSASAVIAAGSAAAAPPAAPTPRPWGGEDLREGAASSAAPLVIWQWCRGTVERDGDLLRLPEAMWTPFLEGNNRAIEDRCRIPMRHGSDDKAVRKLLVSWTKARGISARGAQHRRDIEVALGWGFRPA